jgi:lipid II:glycine glycyltransferase (peptidoglycan interpeptide bridge formation enzyme)
VVGEATAEELASWDVRVVDVPGGDVHQSLAWGAQRERAGARSFHLLLDDGSCALVLGRCTRVLGGGRAYVPRGPVAAGADARVVAGRLAAITAWAADAGFAVVVADPEIPAGSGFPALLAGLGFHQVEEIVPSRHRVGVAIAAGASDADLLAGIAAKTRQQFLAAERKGLRIRRYDVRAGGDPGPGVDAPPPADLLEAAREAFGPFHDILVATGERRGFSPGSRPAALAWWLAALEAGHLALLEARGAEGELVAGAIFYRHGDRLTYGHSGDVATLRFAYPGAMGLILWRALQLAAREGRNELDLGGVDVRGARREPLPGEPTYGLLKFKQTFGGQWIELSGAHERVLRRGRYALSRGIHGAAGAAAAVPGRIRGVARRPGASAR